MYSRTIGIQIGKNNWNLEIDRKSYWRIIRKGKKTWVNTQHDVICLEQGEGICSLDLKSLTVGYMINSNKLVSYLIEIQLVFFPFVRCGHILYNINYNF